MNRIIRQAVMLTAVALAAALPARAQTFSTPGMPNPTAGYDQNPDKQWLPACDGDVMNTIFGKAWLNAQQDVIMGETILRKPDSVLEYSCFHQFVRIGEALLPPLFAESAYWENMVVDVGSPFSSPYIVDTGFINTFVPLEDFVEGLVIDSLISYLYVNFWHTYLGGTMPGFAVPDPGGPNYTCAAMDIVWNTAKCKNVEEPFYTFEDMVNMDPRIYPDPMTCDNTAITQPLIDLSNNLDFQYARFDAPVPIADLTEPGACGAVLLTGLGANRHNAAITAGVVTGMGATAYQEGVCSNPACVFINGACVP